MECLREVLPHPSIRLHTDLFISPHQLLSCHETLAKAEHHWACHGVSQQCSGQFANCIRANEPVPKQSDER